MYYILAMTAKASYFCGTRSDEVIKMPGQRHQTLEEAILASEHQNREKGRWWRYFPAHESELELFNLKKD